MSAEVVQGSPEWFAARIGKVTASRVADVIAKTKTGYGASRANYMAELLCERLTGQAAERFTNAAMQHGTETEPEARTAYEFRFNVDVVQVGFIKHFTIGDTGASPDGLVGNDGMIEIKAPNSATHIETLLTGDIPAKYITQMMWQMACTRRLWCDFVSYDPRLPEEMRMFVKRVDADPAMIESLESEVLAFLTELRAKEHALRLKYCASEPEPEIVQFMFGG
jgi:putative phage-type endonuclease